MSPRAIPVSRESCVMLTKFPYGYQTATEDNVYVLPKPDDEIEFGDYYTTDETK